MTLNNILKMVREWWERLFQESSVKEIEFIPMEKPEPVMETNEDKLIKYALEALDTDITPKDKVPDYVACAEVVSTLIKKVLPDFPILSSTKDLDMKMFMDKRFIKRDLACRGRIIVSPRTKTKNGHVGIFITNDKIASNYSPNGLFTGRHTLQEWIDEFVGGRGLTKRIYELLD